MNRVQFHGVLLFALSIGGATPTCAEPEVGSGVAEVRACMERASPQQSATADLVIETTAGGDLVSRLSLKFYGKRDEQGLMRVLLRVEESPELEGYAVLAREQSAGEPEIFTYLPGLRAVRRITGGALSGSLLGTDLNYEDLLQLLAFTRAGKVERRADDVIDGRPVYVLAMTPLRAVDSAYAQITSQIDREHCILRRASFHTRLDYVAKELLVPWDPVISEGAFRIPQLVIMKNFAKETETRLMTTHPQYDATLRDSLFTTAELAQGR